MQPNNKIPAFDQALEALKAGNGAILQEATFALDYDDATYIGQVIEAVKKLLHRSDLTPQQIVSIGRALHGLNRLPLRTPGLDVHLALVINNESGAESYDLFLSEDRFATESGGYVNSGHGSDSFSGPTFEVESEYRGLEGWHFGVLEWPKAFSQLDGAELKIEDISDDSLLDWEHPDGSVFWHWIANHE
jgi:hypothetical protein